MTKARRFFEAFDLALGRFIALMFGVAGTLALFIALEARDVQDALLPIGIGLGLLLVAAAMLYRRVTFLNTVQFFASGGSSN